MHVDIAPAHCFADASAECFRDRFLRREPGREMARWKFHRDAISNLALGENPLHETFAKTIERVLDALDLDHVDANAEHAHREYSSAARLVLRGCSASAMDVAMCSGERSRLACWRWRPAIAHFFFLRALRRGACAPQILNALIRRNY